MKKFVLIMMAFGLCYSCGKKSTSDSEVIHATGGKPTPRVDPIVADEYLHMVNVHRRKLGLRSVEASDIIEEVSLSHSRAMARGQKFFGHNGWRTRCQQIRQRLRGNLCGEIVARGQKTSRAVFKAWLDSPSHREVIEGPTYTHTGLGYVADRNGVMYWTQLFLEIE